VKRYCLAPVDLDVGRGHIARHLARHARHEGHRSGDLVRPAHAANAVFPLFGQYGTGTDDVRRHTRPFQDARKPDRYVYQRRLAARTDDLGDNFFASLRP